MKDIIEIPFGAYDSELKGFEYTIPEGFEAEIKDGKVIVQQKESEDERMVRIIENVICTNEGEVIAQKYGLKLTDLADWLEKQKEQKPLSTEETELNSIAFLEQMGYTCIPPKKEHQNNSDAPKNALGGALNSPLDKDKNLDDIAQDYVEAVKEYNPEPTWNLMQTAVCYGYHLAEQKPAGGSSENPNNHAEWSEEDETMWSNLIGFLEGKVGMLPSGKERYIKWLKERFVKLVYPKPGWKPSEEQMSSLWQASIYYKSGKIKITGKTLESLYDDLKKLM